jgi:hypothetical protein
MSSRLAPFILMLVLCTARANAQTDAEPLRPASPETSAELLSQAEEAVTTIDYGKTRELAQRAIAQGGLGLAEHTRAYTLLALSCSQLDDSNCAEQAFLRLFALEPKSNIAMRLAPSRRSGMLNARGFWSVRKSGFHLDVTYVRREEDLIVSVRDPINWVHEVEIGWRFADRPYVKARRSLNGELVLHVDDVALGDDVEVYARALDEHGNVVMEFGREREPHVFEPSDKELAEIRRRDIRGGQTGSFARRLEELGVQVSVHGYTSLELSPGGEEEEREEEAGEGEVAPAHHIGFDLHHATAMIRGSLADTAAVEVALEWEHLGRDTDGFYFPHAFMDLRFDDLLILRAGFFEAPVGAFNEYLYPDFLRITALPPLFAANVIPALWSEVGVQLRGRARLGAPTLTYAIFLSNGLEQPDPEPNDGVIVEGGELSGMRFNARDENDGHKSVGGRLGLEIGEADVGVSGYTGQYTAESGPGRRLSIVDADFSVRSERLTLRGEGAIALEEGTDRLISRQGFYLLGAVRPIGYLEPYAQYDYVHNAAPAGERERLQRVLVGCALYPFPDQRVTSSLRLKSEVGYEYPEEGRRSFVWHFQLTMGF